MGTSQFERWREDVSSPFTRRWVLRGLLLSASIAGMPLAALTPLQGAAKKKHRKRRKKQACNAGSKRCGRVCIPIDTCCSDADCDAPAACLSGKCAVPCGQACDDVRGTCAISIDGAEVCAGKVFEICSAQPCVADGQCDVDEVCIEQDCPPVGGITNRCFPLQLP
jgi:hypothetical protein